MKKVLPEWKEDGVVYEGQINNNFQIDFKLFDCKISFIKDRGILQVGYYKLNNYVSIGNIIYDSILKMIPDQNPNWRLSICTELIDYYINFLKQYFDDNEEDS